MIFQWLQMRLSEEKDRRTREAQINERLPKAVEEMRLALTGCVDAYCEAFGAESAEVQSSLGRLRVVVREQQAGKWQQRGKVEVTTVPDLPGLHIDRNGQPLTIEVGLLPGERLFYRDTEADQYLTMDELTRRILDRTLFPKLRE